MDFFHSAKVVRLRSHHSKYLLAEEDEESVTQDRKGSSKNARWTVEFVPGSQSIIRLKSCYGKYLTASNQRFLLGMTGRKVLQTLPHRLDSSLEWEPVRDGSKVKLKTRYGKFLRANGGLPPWRNSVTHDIPQQTATQDWVLWDVDVIEIQLRPTASSHEPSAPPIDHSDSLDFESTSPFPVSANSEHFSRQESTDSHTGSPPKSEGRTIYYHIADEDGEVDDNSTEGYALSFKGSGVEELTQKLREDTGLDEIVVCTRSPLNGNLYPLPLQLPPNNANVHVVVVPLSSTEGRTIYYHIADEDGEVDDNSTKGYALSFKGSGVEKLTQKLREDTGLEEIVVCTRSPLNGNLYPLPLQLPPNNADVHVVVVPSSSTAAKESAKQGSTLS
ncbi:hypothetical protein SLA2020_141800 [Shorea laevis]